MDSIFEPLWRCKYSVFEHYGEGCLKTELWDREKDIEEFSVKTNSFEITIKPKNGEIFTDSILAIKTFPGKLIWMREMKIEVSINDSNQRSSPSLIFYRIGIHNTLGNHGYKLFDNGILALGI